MSGLEAGLVLSTSLLPGGVAGTEGGCGIVDVLCSRTTVLEKGEAAIRIASRSSRSRASRSAALRRTVFCRSKSAESSWKQPSLNLAR